MMEPVPPAEVPTGPVMENVLTGESIDLLKFPAPKWHEEDGNRYLGTGVCVIQRDPETSYVNVGCYRIAVQDQTTCGIFQGANNHGDRIRRKHWARGEKCPVVVVVGEDPILTVLAGGAFYRAPWGTSEFDIAGYLQGDPYPVVRGPVTGLPIPASAEIAFEGFILSPEERMEPEGPFGEWTGYYGHGRRPETVIEVAAMYHRNDPIIFGDPPVRPIRAYHEVRFFNFGSQMKARLEQQGIKGVKSVFQIARPSFSVIALEQLYEGHVEEVIRALVPGGDQGGGHQIWVCVDDDIDPTNTKEVLWAIASRCIPEQDGIRIIPGTSRDQLDPRVPPGDRSDPSQEGRRPYVAHNVVINACRPYAWKDEFPPVNRNSRELTARIEKKWESLFAGLPDAL
jgi:4-hydroxy-3-polyprenylbenzoate decarboxylase